MRWFLAWSGSSHKDAPETVRASRLRAGTAAYGLEPDQALPVYRAARPGATPGDLLAAVATDWFYRIPAIRLAESVPGSHLYEFAWRSPRFGARLGSGAAGTYAAAGWPGSIWTICFCCHVWP
ncbi:hypothetical protein [Streptomyces hygroscopicus]|uniref:hypothetical protein n=1 Tax=Streptomyces hygroscopicus TaxID=1912 RepID=UPI00340788BC